MDYLSIIKQPIMKDLDDFIALFQRAMTHDDGMLGSALSHIRQRGGKRMRPILTLLMARNYGEISAVTQHSAVGLELLHTASLVHDDVVDESGERRGQASVNATFNNKVAVLVGDYILSTALLHVAYTGHQRIIEYLAELGRTLAAGEILQLSNIQNQAISEDVYYQVIKQKTAALFEACAAIGAISAGASDDALKMTSLQQSEKTWCRSIVRGIKVEGGRCNVMLVVKSDVSSSCQIDGLKLIKGRKPFEILKGGDASYVTYLEKIDAGLYDNGVKKDAFKLFKEKGFNTVRFRLYKDPGNPDYEASSQIPEGCQTTEAILDLAKRAKAEGLKILLSFHYSDTWTNPGQQIMPHEWEGLSWEELQTAFYEYTKDVMMKMRDQGTTPEYVAIGNETQSGLCHPIANHENYDKVARLYTLGYEAVKEVSPESQVIIHVSNGGDPGYYWFFGLMRQYDTKFDLIGISYYPFDTPTKNFKWSDIRKWAEGMYKEFGKETIMMETGYNWSPTIPMGIAGQLWDDGVYKYVYPYTPQGQKNYMLEAFNEMKLTEDCHILGVYYWDPLLRYVKDDHNLDWGNGACSEAFFDFEGNALPVFEAYTYNN